VLVDVSLLTLWQDLDDQKNAEDSDSESDEEEEVPPPSRGPFKLGKFCRLRAEVFHEFSHWGTLFHQRRYHN
jgi:hypothetical protein